MTQSAMDNGGLPVSAHSTRNPQRKKNGLKMRMPKKCGIAGQKQVHQIHQKNVFFKFFKLLTRFEALRSNKKSCPFMTALGVHRCATKS